MKRSDLIFALLLSACAAGCTTSDPAALAQNDPFEPTNRAVFNLDVKLDDAVAKPVAKFYKSAVPEPAREGVHNVLTNLNAPVVLANDVLQGEGTRAGQTAGRFVINSTIGLAGLIDVAGKMGIPGHDEDFGQTLAVWGSNEGSYLVLPLIGPKPPRDLVGMVVDIGFDPLTYIRFHDDTTFMIVRGGLGVLDDRAANIDNIEQIERSSIDFYATTRSLYRQHRNAEIRNGAPDMSAVPDL
jgi:phospholipid-binding lipoprotein MlaA